MKVLRGKSLSQRITILFLTILLIILPLAFLSNHFLVHYYSKKILKADGIIHSKYVLNYLSKEVNYLLEIAKDWGKWDDTYNFLKTKNPEYIRSNFEGPTLEDLNLNFFLFFDKSNNFFFGRGYDKEKDLEYTLEEIPPQLKSFFKRILSSGKKTGYFKLNKIVYLYALYPVLRSSGQGPSVGKVLVAKQLSVSDIVRNFPEMKFFISFKKPEGKALKSKVFTTPLGNVSIYVKKVGGKVLLDLVFSDESFFVLNCSFSSLILKLTTFAVCSTAFVNLLGSAVFLIFIYLTIRSIWVKKIEKLSSVISKIDPRKSSKIALPEVEDKELMVLNNVITKLFKELKDERDLFFNLFNIVNAGIIIHDFNKYYLVNDHFLKLTGYSKEEIYSMRIEDVFHPEEREKLKEIRVEFEKREKKAITYESKFLTKEGDIRYVLIRSINLDYKCQKMRLASITDISHLKEAESKIKKLVYFDELTGLYNKNYLIELLNEFSAKPDLSNKVALILLDLKNFSLLNFYWGYEFGNAVLKEVGGIIKSLLRKEDFGFRLEVDKFGILICEDLSLKEYFKISSRFKQGLTQKIKVKERVVDLGCYVGGSIYPDVTDEISKLLEHSEMALSVAKREKLDECVVFDKAIEEKIKKRISLEELLKSAIEKEEFSVNYQPVFRVDDLKLVQFEALIRWYCSKLNKFIPPSEFIPVAEDSGLVVEITRMIIKKVCEQISIWNSIKGRDDFKVAVNISALDFKSPDFLSSLKEAVIFHKIKPHQLELEITERILVENNEFSLKMLQDMKFMGFSIAVDDFGTGYSSLAYLSQFPIDVLKIDLSFVQRIGKSRQDEIIIETIINLGHSLNLKVLAEGVETEEQLKFLKSKRCDYIQGYYLGKPMSPSEITENYFVKNNGLKGWFPGLK